MGRMKKFNEEKFLRIYRGNEKFVNEEKEYYQAFLDLLENRPLLKQIKFANDVLCISPFETFIRYTRDYLGKDMFKENMSRVAKQGLGACFSYLYRQMYSDKYEPVQCWCNDEITGVKTASRFVKTIKK